MGYPMTYLRVINRNQLHDGGYDHERHGSLVVAPEGRANVAVWRTLAESLRDELNRRIDRDNFLRGDLRRLERDTVDERATASYISNRTGIDIETVAAVLKEFMAW